MDYTWLIIFRESEKFESINILFVEEMSNDYGDSEEPLLVLGEKENIHL